LLKGQRAKCRVAGRIIYHLLQYVEDVVLAKEANETLMVTGSIAQKKAAKHVRDWQVGSEVQHELWRGEALALYARAKNTGTEKERQKLLRRAAQVDKELIHVEKISWLVVQNLDTINPIVAV
jgi:DNA-directed RNA polymerase beta' subunit